MRTYFHMSWTHYFPQDSCTASPLLLGALARDGMDCTQNQLDFLAGFLVPSWRRTNRDHVDDILPLGPFRRIGNVNGTVFFSFLSLSLASHQPRPEIHISIMQNYAEVVLINPTWPISTQSYLAKPRQFPKQFYQPWRQIWPIELLNVPWFPELLQTTT